jgi:hypothetical protein
MLGAEDELGGYGVYELEPERTGVFYRGTSALERVGAFELMTSRDAEGLGTDSCFGDSGGPLYWTDPDDRIYVVGVVSRGTEDTDFDCGDGGIYTRVDAYLEFIAEAQAGRAPRCAVEDNAGDAGVAPSAQGSLRGGAACAARAGGAPPTRSLTLVLCGLLGWGRRRRRPRG